MYFNSFGMNNHNQTRRSVRFFDDTWIAVIVITMFDVIATVEVALQASNRPFPGYSQRSATHSTRRNRRPRISARHKRLFAPGWVEAHPRILRALGADLARLFSS